MKKILRFLIPGKLVVALMAAALVVGQTSAVHADVWLGGGVDNEFSTAFNWDTDQVPFFTDNSTNTTNDINGAFTVVRSVDSAAGRTFVSGGAALNVTGGTHSDARPGANIRNFVGRGSFATVNQSGGTYNIGHMLSIGGGGASGDGAYYLTGGDLIVSRGANSIIDGSNPLGQQSLEISDEEDAGAGLFEISGGSLATRIGAGVGTTGVFRVVGSGASSIGIGSNNALDGSWLQQPGGTLSAVVDGGGLTPIFIDEVDGDDGTGGNGDVVFLNGSLLDVGFVGAEMHGIYTVMSWEGTVDNQGLAFAPGVDTDLWSFAVNANSLTINAGNVDPNPTGDADFDADKDVDGKDFLTWQQNVGFTAPVNLQPFGDANGDDVIDGVDLAVWEFQYGSSTPSLAASSVPEPTSIVLLTLGSLAVLAVRRKA